VSSHSDVCHLSIKLVHGLAQPAWAAVTTARLLTPFEGLADAGQQATDDGVAVPGGQTGVL
jgi:hypothetical protein